jgi:hypothetical protein
MEGSIPREKSQEEDIPKSAKDWVYPKRKWKETITLAYGWMLVLISFAYIGFGIMILLPKDFGWYTWIGVWIGLSFLIPGVLFLISGALLFQSYYKWVALLTSIAFCIVISDFIVYPSFIIGWQRIDNFVCMIFIPSLFLIFTYIIYWINRKNKST